MRLLIDEIRFDLRRALDKRLRDALTLPTLSYTRALLPDAFKGVYLFKFYVPEEGREERDGRKEPRDWMYLMLENARGYVAAPRIFTRAMYDDPRAEFSAMRYHPFQFALEVDDLAVQSRMPVQLFLLNYHRSIEELVLLLRMRLRRFRYIYVLAVRTVLMMSIDTHALAYNGLLYMDEYGSPIDVALPMQGVEDTDILILL